MNRVHAHELGKNNYALIMNCFNTDECTLAVKSVLHGQSPGVVYVDSVISPGTAFVWNNEHNFFILGAIDNREYNEHLSTIIYEKIFNQVRQKDNLLDFYVRCFPNNCNCADKYEETVSALFRKNPVMICSNRYYSLDFSEYKTKEWKNILPDDGISIEFIDNNFLKKTHLENFDQIAGWINENWISEEVFLKEGFGFCLVKDDIIASWCISDYNINKQGEIGVETDDRYWRKGYAAVVVTEVLNYCKNRGLKKIGWHCRDNNTGSYKLAEKVGFKRMDNYHEYHAWFNVLDNFLVNGYYYLTNTQQYRKAAESYEKAFEMKNSNNGDYLDSYLFSQSENIKWYYYNTACAWALAGESKYAFSNLEKAVEAGWDDANRMDEDTRLCSLKGDSKWTNLRTDISSK